MIKKLVFNIISSILGLFIAGYLVPGFESKDGIKAIIIVGLVLGLANFFVKPVLKLITFPLRLITLGIFTFVIDIFLVWVVIDLFMWQYIEITGIITLLWTTVAVWCSNYVFSFFAKK